MVKKFISLKFTQDWQAWESSDTWKLNKIIHGIELILPIFGLSCLIKEIAVHTTSPPFSLLI